MLRNLRTQLPLSILLILLVMVTLISVVSNWFINREFEKYMIQQENERSVSVVNDLGNQYNDLAGGWNQDFLHTIGIHFLCDGYPLRIYDACGTFLWDTGNHDMSLCGQIMGEVSDRMKDMKKSGASVIRTYPVSYSGKQAGSASITYYGPYFFTESDCRFIKALDDILLVVGLLPATFAVVVGTLLARRIAWPISKTAYIATQIPEGNYGIRFESTPNIRELEEMVTAVNHLVQTLSEQKSL